MGSKKLNLSTNPKLIQRRKNKEHTHKKLKFKKNLTTTIIGICVFLCLLIFYNTVILKRKTINTYFTVNSVQVVSESVSQKYMRFSKVSGFHTIKTELPTVYRISATSPNNEIGTFEINTTGMFFVGATYKSEIALVKYPSGKTKVKNIKNFSRLTDR